MATEGRWLQVVAVVVAAVMMGGCVGADSSRFPDEVEWDLSESHRAADVDWDNDLSAFMIQDGVEATVRLPGGHTLHDEFLNIGGSRDGLGPQTGDAPIETLDFYYEPRTVEDAYALATRLGQEWGVPMSRPSGDGIDRWYEERLANRARGQEERTDRSGAWGQGEPLAEGGPIPQVTILHSYVDERPITVKLSFYWPPDDEPAGDADAPS